MLRINQLKLKVGHSEEQLKKKLVRELKIRPEELQKFEIRRQSIDARKKPELYYVYSIDVQVKKEKEVLKKHPKNVQKTQDVYYQMPKLQVCFVHGSLPWQDVDQSFWSGVPV